ncbi:MAG: outer membrane protein assembly factor BamB family protein, partial [Candidatus Thorarchaeota archaeon]
MERNNVSKTQNEKSEIRAPLEKVWEFETRVDIGPRLVTNDLIFFGCVDGWLYAFDVTSGQQRWAIDIGTKVQVFGLVRIGNTLYVSGEDSVLYSIDAQTGKVRWQFANTMPLNQIFGNGMCFTVTVTKKDYDLCAIDTQTGLEHWRFSTNKRIWYPAIGHERIFFGTENKRIHALDINTGEGVWESASRHKSFSRPAIAKNRVVVCENSSLRAYDANNGTLVWEIKNAGQIRYIEGPTVVGDHVLLPNELTLVNLESGVVSTKLSPGTDHEISRVEGNTVYTICALGTLSAIDLATGEWKWYAIVEPQSPYYLIWDKSKEFVFAAASKSDRTFAFNTSRFKRRWDFPEEARGFTPYVAGEMVIMFSPILAFRKRKVYGFAGSKDPAKQASLD